MYEKLDHTNIEGQQEMLSQLGGLLLKATGDRIVLSDFDYTLCDEYSYDKQTQNHLPVVGEDIISAANSVHLVVATGRRANHPHLPKMWKSGLIPSGVPIIAENGGTLVFEGVKERGFLDLVAAEDVQLLKKNASMALESLDSLPSGQRLVVKQGRTFVIARLEDEAGVVSDRHQMWLENQLKTRFAEDGVQIINSRLSIAMQLRGVNKGDGFLTYLDLLGIKRSHVCVVGMGDADNDTEIFDVSDVRIGFSNIVEDKVDIVTPNGVPDAAPILRLISSS
jgi:hydroxymethylpyrimidine pyrophosphatase-like HAD family hydrolase